MNFAHLALSRLMSLVDRLLAALADPAWRELAAIGVLITYVLVWTLAGFLVKSNQSVHYDMAGVVAWSRELAFGYPQHPPLAPWLVRAWFSIFPLSDWSYYLLGMAATGIALWFAWRLFACLQDAVKRVLAVVLLTLIPAYNFHALKFDHNAVLLPVWAVATLCFMRSFEMRSTGWAALAGLSAAAAMLAKYWSIFLLAGLALAALTDARRVVYFRSRAPWVTIAVGALLLMPHVAWLWVNDFIPMSYAVGVHKLDSLGEIASSVVRYLSGAVGYVALPVLLVAVACRPSRAAVRDMLWPPEPTGRFIATAFWTPLLLPPLVTMAVGLELNPIWSMAGLMPLPLLLLSSPQILIGRNAVRGIVALAVALPPLMVLAAPAIAVFMHGMGLVPPTAAHGRLLAERVEREWRKATDRPLRLVGGDLDLANVVAFYLPDQPSTFALSEPQLTPWATDARIGSAGIAIVCHASGAGCLHQKIAWAIHFLWTKSVGRPRHRTVFELERSFLGWSGRPAPYVIVIIPPG